MGTQADIIALEAAVKLFRATFDADPTVAGAAPGRVNLIGEHVDYNDGFVFPLALEKNTYIVAAPQPSPTVTECEVISSLYPGKPARFTPGDTPVDPKAAKWTSYLKGMTAVYARRNITIPPFRAAIVSDVPTGAGLSSSAAMEIATAIMMEELSGTCVDATARALMGQQCEHEFAGVPCGIMDQFISSRAVVGHALLIDCRSHAVTPVPLDHTDAVIVVADSRVTHELSGSEYPLRRQQCAAAADAMKKQFPQQRVTHLRDCTVDMLLEVEKSLDAETIMRARHAIWEDRRTLEAKQCLEGGDLERVGKLMHLSHESLRILFQVSTAEINALVNIAMRVDGVYGSRITGGGFGGCTVTLVRKDRVDALKEAFRTQYPKVSGGLEANVFATSAGTGARPLTSMLKRFC